MTLKKRSEKAAEQAEAVETIVEAKGAPIDFPSANAAREVPIHEGFARVLESVFVKDVHATFQEVKEFIDRKGARTRPDVNTANSLLRKAHDLLMTAKRERHRWELDNKVVFAACYEKAVLDIQKEKEAGTRAKQVTDGDVENRFALMYPDEYKHQALKKQEVKLLEYSMENLVEVMTQLARNLSISVKPS